MTRFTPIAVSLALGLSACIPYEPPARDKGDRFLQDEILNTVKGSLTVRGPHLDDGDFRAMVLLFDADSPGPPEGTSGPVDFAVVKKEEFVGDPVYGYRAPFAFTDVADGAYVIDTILDMDGDFQPLAFTLGGATCGDWQGSHFGVNQGPTTTTVTLTDTGDPGPVQVEVPPVMGKGRILVEGGQVVGGIEVTVEQELDTTRPAFTVPNEDQYRTISLTAAGANPTAPLTYKLRSTGIHTAFTEDEDGVLEIANACTPGADPRFCIPETGCESAFSLYYRDADGNGSMDPHPDYPPEFGLKDIYPRVLLQYLGTTETGADGKVVRDPDTGFPVIIPPDLPEGVSWGTENFTYGLEAAFGIPVIPLETPTKVPEITVMFPPLVAKFYDTWEPDCGGEPPEDLSEGCTLLYDLSDPAQAAEVPKGIWGINVISWTGQTWGIPNEISEWGLPATQDGFDPKAQGGFLLTTP